MPETTYIPVHAVQSLDLLLVVLLEVGVEVCLPLPGRDALAQEGLRVVIYVRQEDIQPTKGLLCRLSVTTPYAERCCAVRT